MVAINAMYNSNKKSICPTHILNDQTVLFLAVHLVDKVKWFQLMLCTNSIKKSFVYSHFKWSNSSISNCPI